MRFICANLISIFLRRCELKPRCTTANARKVSRDIDEDVRDHVRALANTEAFQKSRRERPLPGKHVPLQDRHATNKAGFCNTFPLIADIAPRGWYGRKVPGRDIRHGSRDDATLCRRDFALI
jgi:hypothetical protein